MGQSCFVELVVVRQKRDSSFSQITRAEGCLKHKICSSTGFWFAPKPEAHATHLSDLSPSLPHPLLGMARLLVSQSASFTYQSEQKAQNRRAF
jgi:hypothetical protein